MSAGVIQDLWSPKQSTPLQATVPTQDSDKTTEQEAEGDGSHAAASYGKRKREDKGDQTNTSVPSTTAGPKRPQADRKVQEIVPEWYGKRCALSGLPLPDGAHIVPVRLTRVNNGNLKEPWSSMRNLWILPNVKALNIAGEEVRNIIPMNPATHRLWDCFRFALRPIENVTEPSRRIMVQMVWLDDPGAVTGPSGHGVDHRDHYTLGGCVDFRRPGGDGKFSAIEHGDVYEISTADPDHNPLPSLRLLEMQYGAHKLMGGMRAAGILKDIFGDEPPKDDDDGADALVEKCVSPRWQFLIDAAVETGVMDGDTGDLWKKAFARHHFEKLQWMVDYDLLDERHLMEIRGT